MDRVQPMIKNTALGKMSELFCSVLPPSALQAGHGTAAGLSHPGDRHQQAE